MLSIGAMGHGQGTYYVGLAQEDYYLGGGEPPGQWVGQGSARLGLTGSDGSGHNVSGQVATQAEREQFLKLFAGCDTEGRPLVQNAGDPRRQPGWDLTFSAPKSVSTLWAVADESTRHDLQKAHFAALKEALAYLEEGATTRRGHNGLIKEPAHLVIATFEHGTSRAQDPQLHTHCLVLNIGVRPDGTTGALESQHFYRSKMATGALYRAELARQLQGLGFRIEREKNTFEIAGVPTGLREEFSKRRAEIEARLETSGKDTARAAAVAALATRSVKEHRARGELFGEWQKVGRGYNFTNQQVQELKQFAPMREKVLDEKTSLVPVELAEALRLAVETISRDKSHFGERELMRAVAEEAPGRSLSAAQLRAGVQAELQKPEFIRVGEQKGEARYTTQELWNLEKTLLADAAHLSQTRQHPVEQRHYLYGILKAERRAAAQANTQLDAPANQKEAHHGKSLRAKSPSTTPPMTPVLSDEQRAALAYLTKDSGDFGLVSGIAGSGKTFLLEAARESWEAQGYKVIGACVAAKAAQGLEEGAGIKSTTVARLGWEWERGFDRLEVSEQWARKVEWLHATWQIDSRTRRELLAPLEVSNSKLGNAWQYATWQVSKSQKELLDKQIERRERFELDQNTVLVIDEAGMLGTKGMATLLAQARKSGAKIVGIGEERQLPAVEVGGPFGSLLNRQRTPHQSAPHQSAPQLSQIIRQKEAWQREAVKNLAEGNAERALRAYQERGCVTIADTREAAQKALIEKWASAGVKAPEKHVIFAGTRAEVQALNRRAQAARQRAGKLGFRAVRVAGETIYEKDRVLFTKNSAVLGVQNGTNGTVKAVDTRQQTLTVKLDNGVETLISLRDYSAVTLGYALTTHKAQGITVQHSYILCGGPMTSRELTYVQASRARSQTEFFSGRILAWNPDTERREDQTISELARQMSQSRQKDLAHDVGLLVSASVAAEKPQPKMQPEQRLTPTL